MKLKDNRFYTIAPVVATQDIDIKPEFIRLPKPGKSCPYTGLSRGKLNQLVLPNKENHYNPPVKSVSLRPKGCKCGVRLVHYDSLLQYLYAHMDENKPCDDKDTTGNS